MFNAAALITALGPVNEDWFNEVCSTQCRGENDDEDDDEDDDRSCDGGIHRKELHQSQDVNDQHPVLGIACLQGCDASQSALPGNFR